MDAVRDIPPDPGYPPLDFARGRAAMTQGIPLKGHFACDREHVLARNHYNNHPSVRMLTTELMEKIAKDERNSFAIVCYRFTFRFVYGIFLAALGYVIRKGKGRMVVDPSCLLTPGDSGALNHHLDKRNPDDTPPVFFQSTLTRHLTFLWNLRITHPSEDILLLKDDIHAAFRRLRYHVDMAICYAFVFSNLLVIPIGMIFRARNS